MERSFNLKMIEKWHNSAEKPCHGKTLSNKKRVVRGDPAIEPQVSEIAPEPIKYKPGSLVPRDSTVIKHPEGAGSHLNRSQ
jgi:hypothetical protein